jgi:hypothetical protein
MRSVKRINTPAEHEAALARIDALMGALPAKWKPPCGAILGAAGQRDDRSRVPCPSFFVNQPIRCIEVEIIGLTIVALGCLDLKFRMIELHSAAGASFSGNGITQLCSLVFGNWAIGSCGDRCHQRQCA